MPQSNRQKQYIQRGYVHPMISRPERREPEVRLTPEEMEAYLEVYRREGYPEGTLHSYRGKLQRLYEDLPADKLLSRETLENWKTGLLERGFAPSTVNSHVSVVNTFLDHIGHRELQLVGQMEVDGAAQPELSREEYLRLLRSAKLQGKEKAYLLVKLFATTPLPAQELSRVTVEAVREGRIDFLFNRVQTSVKLPAYLRQELLRYAEREGRLSGPLFVTREGTPINRTYVNIVLRQLCPAAQVPEEKGTPRCLRRLYQRTLAAIQANVALLVERAMEQQLELEQAEIGWEE